MANGTRTRKRVHALRRAPDGSAFHRCDYCGVLVPVALTDMHDCSQKRSKVGIEGLGIQGQPRESFRKTCKTKIEHNGFLMWMNMSPEERQPFIVEAEKVNSAYHKMLLEESRFYRKVDDEADSAMLWSSDKGIDSIWKNEDSWAEYNIFESFNSYDLEMRRSWLP